MPQVADLDSVWNHLKKQNIDLEEVCVLFSKRFPINVDEFNVSFSRIRHPQRNMVGYLFSAASYNINPIYCQPNFLPIKLCLSSFQSVKFLLTVLDVSQNKTKTLYVQAHSVMKTLSMCKCSTHCLTN